MVDFECLGWRLVYSVHLFHLVLVTSVSLLASEEGLAVLVETKGGNDNVGGVDGDLSLLSVGLLLDEFLNVDAPFAAINFSDFALTVLVWATHDLDGVSVSDRDGAALILARELLGEVSGHYSSAEGRSGGEMGLAGLSALGGHALRALHLV